MRLALPEIAVAAFAAFFYASPACRRRDVQSRSSACSTTRPCASSVSTARSSAIAPRWTTSTTSRSTTATARSRPRAPRSTSARPAHVTTISCSCTRTSCCTRSRRSSARRRCWTPTTASGSREPSAWSAEDGWSGRVRDRVVLIGERADGPVDVDAIDEVLFIVPRRVFDRERLSEAPKFAWHAYAVEYGLRLRRRRAARVRGRRAAHPQQPLHQHRGSRRRRTPSSARAYPDALPVRTPSRIVTRRPLARRRGGVIRRHAWRLRWLRESVCGARRPPRS